MEDPIKVSISVVAVILALSALFYVDASFGFFNQVSDKIGNWLSAPAKETVTNNERVIESTCPVTASGYEPITKNCKPFRDNTGGYGLKDCNQFGEYQKGYTTYYCHNKVVSKKTADCCSYNINTGECS